MTLNTKKTSYRVWENNESHDFLLLFIILTLAFISLTLLQPISSIIAQNIYGNPSYFVKKQAVWLGVGILLMLFFQNLKLEILRKTSNFSMVFSIFLLALVFVPGIGKSIISIHGNFNRWIQIGAFSFQPSEFSKIALVVFLSSYLCTINENSQEQRITIKNLLKPILMIGIMLLAILLEPQYGTTICILSVLFLFFYLMGFSIWHLLTLLASILPLLILLAVFWKYRLERIYVWLNPYKYRFEGGYQLVTSFRSFANGKLWGTDLATGLSHKYLTYGHTDFAFALLAEDFGFFGVFCFLLVLLAFLWRAIILLSRVDNPFAFFTGSASLIILVCQSLLNLFVVTGLLPTTGVGLPFLSYGGSSLVTTLIFCGLLLNTTQRKYQKVN